MIIYFAKSGLDPSFLFISIVFLKQKNYNIFQKTFY